MNSVRFRSDIQGLRAVAVLAVIIFHFNPSLLPGGFIGVDVFLVISGYLITCILISRKREAEESFVQVLKSFYISRLKRIAPAYFVMLVLVAIFSAVMFTPRDFDTFKDGLEKAAWFNSNNYFAGFGDYFAPKSYEQPLLHTWSLAVEIQFYLIAPALMLALPVKYLKLFLVFSISFFTLLSEYFLRIKGVEQATYYSLYARLPEFFSGGLVALFSMTSKGRIKYDSLLKTFGIGVVLISAVTQPELGNFPGIAALVPVIGSVLVLISHGDGVVSRFMSSSIMVWIGGLSFSLYLWHWPILAFLRYYSGEEVLDLFFSFVFALSTLCLSIASYYVIEKFFRGGRHKKKQALGCMGLALATIFTSKALGGVNEFFSPRELPVEYHRYADSAEICHGHIVKSCLQGDLSSNKEFLVLGDSHAAMLNYFFDYLGNRSGFKARIITSSSCVTIPGFDYQRIPEWAQQACLDQIEEAKEYIEKSKTVFLAGTESVNIVAI